ncbi:DUF433 domain-containing protein [Leptolyngbya iicbica]|uniref:DUF433 domain-containing protein n=1 Tax=Leptolyngbya iicbica TaxID=3161580 RepID=UPI00269F23DE
MPAMPPSGLCSRVGIVPQGQSWQCLSLGSSEPDVNQLRKAMNYKDFITVEPGKRGGKPCVRGLRITVYEVLEYLASEMTEAEILDDFPDLTREDLKACIAYAADRERRYMTAS